MYPQIKLFGGGACFRPMNGKLSFTFFQVELHLSLWVWPLICHVVLLISQQYCGSKRACTRRSELSPVKPRLPFASGRHPPAVSWSLVLALLQTLRSLADMIQQGYHCSAMIYEGCGVAAVVSPTRQLFRRRWGTAASPSSTSDAELLS